MGKYIFVLKNSIQRQLFYRFNTLAIILSGFINFGVLFYFWNSVYMQGNQVGNYTLQEIVSYYFLVAILGFFVRPIDVAWRIGDDIRFGGITSVLLRPINYFWYNLFESLGSLIFITLAYIPFVAVISFFIKDTLKISSDPFVIFFSFISVVLAFLINFIIFYAVGISSFYFGMVKGLNYSVFIISMFLSGSIIPLSLFPKSFISFLDFLPFKYVFFVPIEILSGRINPEINFLIIPLGWIIGLSIVSFFIYKYGVKKYEGYGA